MYCVVSCTYHIHMFDSHAVKIVSVYNKTCICGKDISINIIISIHISIIHYNIKIINIYTYYSYTYKHFIVKSNKVIK